MTPGWGPGGLAPENRRVDKRVRAECRVRNDDTIERFMDGEEVNEIVCLETGEWDSQFDDCESRLPCYF